MAIYSNYPDPNKLLSHQFPPPIPHQLNPYPVNAFPPVFRNVINALHEDTQIPIEMIGSTVLAAASLALQPLIDIIPPHSNEPEPCSLYFLTIADSGEGKSSINKRIMKPFYEFSSQMKGKYLAEFRNYQRESEIWKMKKQALASSYRMAVKHGGDGEDELFLLQEHQQTELIKPKCLNLIYEDATPKSLIQGLGDYPFAGIISDEAITFFKGYLKNNIGLLNKAWEGETYSYNRPDGERLDIKACLTLSLMSQSAVFFKFMDKYEDLFESSGFLSRLLITKTVSTVGHRTGNTNYNKSNAAIEEFHKYLYELLLTQENSHKNLSIRTTMKLSGKANNLWALKNTEYQSLIVKNGMWEHIRSFVSKASMNAIKIAAILNYKNGGDISEDILSDAHQIINWHLNQASIMFIEKSYQFKTHKKLQKLLSWITEKAGENSDGLLRIPRSRIMTSGPEFVRSQEAMDFYLKQLIDAGCVISHKEKPSAVEYISINPNNPKFIDNTACVQKNQEYTPGMIIDVYNTL